MISKRPHFLVTFGFVFFCHVCGDNHDCLVCFIVLGKKKAPKGVVLEINKKAKNIIINQSTFVEKKLPIHVFTNSFNVTVLS